MNRQGELSPTLYYPVLGQEGSEKQAGDSVRFGFRVSMTDKGWYEAHKHAVYDIYGLGNSLALKHTTLPLYKRMEAIWDYILGRLALLLADRRLQGADHRSAGLSGAESSKPTATP